MCWEDGALVNLILSRLSSSFIALIGAAFFAFVALRLAPGDAARLTLGAFATDEALAALRSEMGLDRSVPEQFLIYLWDFFTGNWGRSYSLGEPVRSLLANRFPATLELGLYAFAMAFTAALTLALWGAHRRGRISDGLPKAMGVLALGIPQFWFGLVLLIVGFELTGLFPGPLGRLPTNMPAPVGPTGLFTVDALLSGDFTTFTAALHHLILPALALGLLPFGFLYRLLRANLEDVSQAPFALVARAHGQSRLRVMLTTLLPNAIIPTLTASGLIFGQLLAGSVLVERVFNWPGAGMLVTQGVLQQDYSVVQVFILLSALVYIVTNLFVDIIAGMIDPRFAQDASR